jgi:hypothetical protein
VTARERLRRALPAAAAAIYVAAVLLWVGGDRRSARAVFPAGSVWNTGDDGLSLAYAYLGASAGAASVAVMTRSLDAAPLPARGVLFRVEPDAGLDVVRRALAAAGRDGGDGDDDGSGESPGGGKAGKGDKADKDSKKDDQGAKGSEKGDQGAKGAKVGKVGKVGSGSGGDGPAGKSAPRQAEEGAGDEPLVSLAEASWVRGGGRLVLAVSAGASGLEVTPLPRPSAVHKVFPIWPGVERLLPDPERALGGLPLANMHVLWVAGEAAIVARSAAGAGDVIVLACPEILHNRLLGRGDHLALLAALAGRQSAGPGGGARPVFFDERTHGAAESAGVVEILNGWGLGPLLLLLGLAGAAAWWRAAVRVGPAERDDPDVRSEAVELVDSLADLYQRALGRGDALRLYRESLMRTVAADTGLKGAPLAARVAGLAPGLPPEAVEEPPPLAASAAAGGARAADLQPAAFRRALQILNDGFRRLDDAKRR